MTDERQRIEQAKWLFERTLGWIATADVKVGVAVAIDTAMLGGIAAAFTASDPHSRSAWCYVALISATGGLVVAVFCAAMAAIPRILGPVSSLIYFGRISERSAADYIEAFATLSEEAFLKDLTTQIHRNAQIATEKHVWVRMSILWSFLAGIPWLAAIALLVRT